MTDETKYFNYFLKIKDDARSYAKSFWCSVMVFNHYVQLVKQFHRFGEVMSVDQLSLPALQTNVGQVMTFQTPTY